MRRGCGGLLAAALLIGAAACTQGEAAPGPTTTPLATATSTPESPDPTTTATPSPTPTEPADPFAVPEVITSDYVRRVLQELVWIEDAGFRRIVEEAGELTEDNLAFLDAIRTPENAEAHRQLYVEDAASGVLTSHSREERGMTPLPEPSVVRQIGILDQVEGCLWVESVEDVSASLVGPAVDVYQYYALVPKDSTEDPESLNPTPWVIAQELRKPDGTRADPPPEERCP